MQITIRLLASFREYLPTEHDDQGAYTQEIPAGTPVRRVLQALSIPPADRCTFFVNGRHGTRDQILEDGDVLTLFPAVGGGQ